MRNCLRSLIGILLIVSAALTIAYRPAAAQEPDAPVFISFDAPGAGTGAGMGTYPVAINQANAVTGNYYDGSFVSHGFVRAHGVVTASFDAPNAINGTFPVGINSEGAITGYFYDANLIPHGFLRATDGSIVAFDAPGAVNGTSPLAINSSGEITGNFADLNVVLHGFLRTRDGRITTFDVAGAGSGFLDGTLAFGNSPFGGTSAGIAADRTITGAYADMGVLHGFIRSPDGSISTFDVPDGSYTGPTALGKDEGITGSYFEPIAGNPLGGNFRGFLRTRNGDFSTFDAATYSPCCIWTFPEAINPEGSITGYDNDGHNRFYAFVRTREGEIATFSVPGAGTAGFQGTLAFGINPAGAITGRYIDASNVSHGFIRMPQD
jgi:hypothetical protein